MMRRLYFELLLESLQIVSVNVGNGPVIEVRVSPMQKLIALVRYRLRGFSGIGRGRPDEEVNEMFTPLVNQRRHRPVIEIIKTAADQRKSFVGKIDHRRCKIKLCVQPRFHGVLIGRSDVGEMVCHQRTHMTGDKLRCQKLIGPRASQLWRQVRKDDRSENDGGCETETRETEPIPWRSQKNGSRLWLLSWEQRLSIWRNISHGTFGDLFSQRRLNSLT